MFVARRTSSPLFSFFATPGLHGMSGQHIVPPGLGTRAISLCYKHAIPPGFKRRNIIFQTTS